MPTGQRGAVAGQADDPHVVAEVLAAELGADAELLGQREDLAALELEVAERRAQLVAAGRQAVEVAGRGQLGRLQGVLGRRAADDDGQVVGRAGRRAERAQLLVEERQQARRVEQRLGLLEQVALVGRAAALGHEQELVLVAVGGVDLDLGRQVGAGVDLLAHVERRHLRVAQVRRRGTCRRRRGRCAPSSSPPVTTSWPFLPMTIAVPVSWQPGRTPPAAMLGVLQQLEGDEAVVGRGLGVVEDAAQLRRCPGRSRWAMSRIASRGQERSAPRAPPRGTCARRPRTCARRRRSAGGTAPRRGRGGRAGAP